MSPNWLALIGLLALTPGPIQAHDIYSHLVDDLGRRCCNDVDCRPARYRLRATGVEMFVYGHWIAVPSDKILYRALPGDTGETSGGHWCGMEGRGEDGSLILDDPFTRCAILPPQSATVDGGVP
jgi:hypothetical protein